MAVESKPSVSSFRLAHGFGPVSRWVAPALWLVSLALVARLTVFIRPRAPGEFTSVDTSALAHLILVFLTSLILLASGRILVVWRRLRGTSMRTLYYYYLLSALSALWSAVPEYSLYRGVEFIIMFSAVIVALSYARDLRAAEITIFWVTLLVILFTVTVTVKLHGFSLSLMHWHTNSYSASALMLFCYCVGEYFTADRSRRGILRFFGAIGFFFLALGTSAASNVSAAFGILIAAFLLGNRLLVIVAVFIVSIAIPVVILTSPDPDLLYSILFPGKDEHDIVTMKGRTNIWEDYLQYFLQSPFIGQGFAAISGAKGQILASNPHNSLISVLLGSGLLGLTVVMIYFIRLLRECLMTARHHLPGSVGAAAALGAGLMNSLAMPLVLNEWEESSLVFACFSGLLLLFVILPHQLKRQETGHAKADPCLARTM